MVEQPITVQVEIEDRKTSGISVTCSLLESSTIGQLKQQMCDRFSFPIEVQRCIINQRLVPDHHTLAMHALQRGGEQATPLYLYLVPMQRAAGGGAPGGVGGIGVSLSRETIALPSATHQSEPPTEGMAALGLISGDYANLNSTSGSEIEFNLVAGASRGDDPDANIRVGWTCPACTFINVPLRPGCELCAGERPANYTVPPNYIPSALELQRFQQQDRIVEDRQVDYSELVRLTQAAPLVLSRERFQCQVCLDNVEPGEGITLRNCLHTFCKECLHDLIVQSNTSQVPCPYSEEAYRCTSVLEDMEVRQLVDDVQYNRYLMLSPQEAEIRDPNSYHCQTANCVGWCVYEDDVNEFSCSRCGAVNCLTCKAIHVNQTCHQYQSQLKANAPKDKGAKKTQRKIDAMLKRGTAMRCPTCDIVLMKKDGCDWVQCTMCRTDICWVTKGPRWGPEGHGDTSAGCRCGVDGFPCHARCNNCH